MSTTMSMTERHKRVEELVMQDPRVLACARTFGDAQADISRWHVTNKTALRATMGQLDELNELIAFSEFCLEDLKCAKRCAYNQLMDQYPHVWDTSCDDPFSSSTQPDVTEAGGETEETATLPETEEMSEVPEPDLAAPPIRGRVYRITAYNADQGGCHDVDPTDVPVWLLDTPNTAIARITRQATLQEIRTLIDDLIDGGGQ